MVLIMTLNDKHEFKKKFLARGTKMFVAPSEHGFSFFQVEIITWRICVPLTGPLLKITKNY